MAMTTKMMIVAIVFYGLIFAAIVAVIVWAVKYLIRYGIDYYFKKLNAQKPSPSGEGGASAPDEGK